MGALLSYSIYSSILLSLLYLSYKWVLAGENQLRFNRAVLWSIYVVSLAALPVSWLLSSWQTVEPVALAPIDFEEIITTDVTYVYEEEPGQPLYLTVMLWLYLGGVVAVLCQTAWIAMRLWRIISRGEVVSDDRFRVIVIDDDGIAPFSWCRYVVMSRRDWEDNGEIILTHELQHLGLRHWIDLLVAQLVGIFQWYNPAAWLMREELKTVHEYQADRAVLESGIGARDYQMLLIRKAVGAKFPSLANSLNHSKLKKRITMMYADPGSGSRRLRGLLLLPALAVALALTDLSAVASVISDTASAEFMSDQELPEAMPLSEDESMPVNASVDALAPDEEAPAVLVPMEEAVVENGAKAVEAESEMSQQRVRNEVGEAEAPVQAVAVEAAPKAEAAPEAASEPSPEPIVRQQDAAADLVRNAEKVFSVVEKKPTFPGGENTLLKYVSRNIRYPREAKDNNIEGRVVVQFVVKKDGTIGPVRVLRSRHPLLDEEAVRVVKTLPTFAPGEIQGEPVSVWYTLPVSFKLEDKQPIARESKPDIKIIGYKVNADNSPKTIVLNDRKVLSDSIDIYVDGKRYLGSIEDVDPSQIASIDVWKKEDAFKQKNQQTAINVNRRAVIHIKTKGSAGSNI